MADAPDLFNPSKFMLCFIRCDRTKYDLRPTSHLRRRRRTRAPDPGRCRAQPDALGGQLRRPRARRPLRRRPLPPGRPAHRADRGRPHLPAGGPGDAGASRGDRTGAVRARRPQPRLAHASGEPDDRQLLAAQASCASTRAHPGIDLRLSVGNTETVTKAVVDGSAELGLVEGAIDAPACRRASSRATG